MEQAQRLKNILDARMAHLNPEIKRRLDAASDVVVFGSFASHLETKTSDLDVFCVGEPRTHYKTAEIEILILPEYELYSDIWLGSELASHISCYGVPLSESPPDWFSRVSISKKAADRKQKRVEAYVRSLAVRWPILSSAVRMRYRIKVERELKRLQLLRNGEPVPPTKALDQLGEVGHVPLIREDLHKAVLGILACREVSQTVDMAKHGTRSSRRKFAM